MKFRVLRGGRDSSLQNKYRFAFGEITDTRLMGVLGMHLHWILPGESDDRDIHQFFYYDVEELGLETMTVYMGDDPAAVEAAGKSLYGGLGAGMVPLCEREARWMACRMVSGTKKKGQILPEAAGGMDFIIKHPVMLSPGEKAALMEKICTPLKTDYAAVHYYLMRLFGKDPEGAALLLAEGSKAENFNRIEPRTHCTFLRNTLTPCEGSQEADHYMCESLVEVESSNSYRMVISEVGVRDRKIVSAFKRSEFPISGYEASMKLARDEYVNLYDIDGDIDLFDLELAGSILGASRSGYQCGDMYMEFKNDNSHVEQRDFRLSDDVQALYFVSDFGELVVGAYSPKAIARAEVMLQSGPTSPYLYSTAKYHFADPVIYEFAQSGYEDFEEFLRSIED